MSDFEKGKICGYGEAIAEMREAAEETGQKMILKELLKVASGTLVELEIEAGDMILRTETLAEVMMKSLNEEKKNCEVTKLGASEGTLIVRIKDEGKAYSDKRATWGWRK